MPVLFDGTKFEFNVDIHYGVPPEKVVDVVIEMHEDQAIPTEETGIDYWGWYSNKAEKIVQAYESYWILLYVLKQQGIVMPSEKGKPYRLKVNTFQ